MNPTQRLLLVVLPVLFCGMLPPVFGQPTFSKQFVPSEIGPGSVSSLRFDIDETSGVVVSDLAFVDVLPASVTIATPARAVTNCAFAGSGGVSAPDGGSTISVTGAVLGAFGSCHVTVDVTASTPGVHMNVSGDLTSSAGNSGPASADLTVATDRPGFSKSFSPSSVALGSRSTLTFTIDNSSNPTYAYSFTFSDNLPAGLEVADPNNVSNTCTALGSEAVVSATPGSGLVSSSSSSAVDAGATCTISVDVVPTGAGRLENTTSEFTSLVGLGFSLLSSGKANAALESTATTLAVVQEFLEDPVPAGGSPFLRLTVSNFDRSSSASNISVSESLSALSGLVALSLPLSEPCGAGSMLVDSSSGQDGSEISLQSGSLAPGSSCSFEVPLLVPPGAATGSYPFVSTAVVGDIDGEMVLGNQASDLLFVQPSPSFSKEFIDDPVGTGNDVTLRYTLSSNSPMSSTTEISFSDELTAVVPFPVSVVLPDTPCGPGSSVSLVNGNFDQQFLLLANGSLAAAGMADDSCTFDVVLSIPTRLPGGVYESTSGPVTATVDGLSYSGGMASDSVTVLAPPELRIEFTNDPVSPGGTVDLEFVLSHAATAPGDALGVGFTNDLAATLSGLIATGLPLSDLCGPGNGSMVGSAGGTFLTFSGATLTPGQVCSFSVTLDVPSGAAVGFYSNETSEIAATILGVNATGPATSDELEIPSVLLSAEFQPSSVVPGELGSLVFTLDNLSPTQGASSISFTTSLSTTLSGLAVEGALPSTVSCGTSSVVSGTTFLTFAGGELAAGESCSFAVDVRVPPGASDGDYTLTTSQVTAVVEGSLVASNPATADLSVSSVKIRLVMEFPEAPVSPGASTVLRFSLTNLDNQNQIMDIAFDNDLDAALPGMTATGLPLSGMCNGTGLVSGASTLSVTGVTLAPESSCSFDVSVALPLSVPSGQQVVNATSEVTGTLNGLPVAGTPAITELFISFVRFEKSFAGDSVPGGVTTLSFTIENLDSGSPVAVAFTDDLGSFLAGTVATSLPTLPCGPGSSLSGSSFVSFAGEIGAGSECTFDIEVAIPESAAIGDHDNVTSPLTSNGLVVAPPAVATLTILDVEPPLVTGVVGVAACSTATSVIDTISVQVFDESSPLVNVADPDNYLLFASGPDGEFETPTCGSTQGDDVEVSILAVAPIYETPNDVLVRLVLDAGGLERGLYRLLVCDGIEDAAGNALDGDNDLVAGGDFELFTFRSDPLNLFDNGHFDDCPSTLMPWLESATPPNTVFPGTAGVDDAIGASYSASAQFDSEVNLPSSLAQCVEVPADRRLDLEASIRLQALVVDAVEVTYGCEFFDQASCQGNSVGSEFAQDTFAFSGPWFDRSLGLSTPAAAASALCSFEALSAGADDSFSLFLDRLFLGEGRTIFEDGFESGDISAWSETLVP